MGAGGQSDTHDPEAVQIEVTKSKPPARGLKDLIIVRFVPAIATCMVWLYLVTYSHGPLDYHVWQAQQPNATVLATPIGALWNELFVKYYPMTLAMIAGSLIAGSTPLGGGVVAFPIAVLVIGFKPPEGRDFTVLIQSVGMNAAAYLIMLKKGHLLDFTLVMCFFVMGIPGVLLGLSLNLSPFYIVLTFQILVLEFAFVFFYLNVLAPRSSPSAVPTAVSKTKADEEDFSTSKAWYAYGAMVVFAFAGGFLTANVGSGSDIILYAFGLLVWNPMVPPSRRYSDLSLTASSVVVMGLLSAVTTVCRGLSGNIETEVLYCWGATAWLVCFGAPLGSLLLTPGLRAQLRIAFYFLAIAQFIGFAVLKIQAKTQAWIIFACVTAAMWTYLAVHYALAKKKIVSQGEDVEPLSPRRISMRLFRE